MNAEPGAGRGEGRAKWFSSTYLAVGVVILILTVASLGPLLYGNSLAEGRVFTWSPASNTFDYSYYLSYMRQGADGLWRVQNLSTTDKQSADVIHLFYVAAGHAAHLFNVPIPIMYHVFRLLVAAGFVLLMWAFLSKYVGERSRTIALLFIVFSSGLGWLQQAGDSIDLWFADAMTFTTLNFWPHMAWALTLKSLAIMCLFVGTETKKVRYGFLAGACCALVTFDHTFDLYGIALFCAVYTALRLTVDRLKGRRLDLRPWANHFAAMALVALPFVGFAYNQYRNNPLMVYRSTINVEIVPTIGSVISGYGLIGLLALVPVATYAPRLRSIWHRDLEAVLSYRTLLFLYAWTAVNLSSMYLLSNTWFGRRLILGTHIPLAILAAVGFTIIAAKVSPTMPRRPYLIIGCLVTAFTSISNLRVIQVQIEGYQTGIGRAIDGICRLYLEQREVDRLIFIGEHASADAVIQPLPTFNGGAADLTLLYFGPWLTGHHETCGHPFETPHCPQRLHSLEKIAQEHQGVVVQDANGAQILPL